MVEESELKEELRKKIMFGINQMAILYNNERINNPEKYDFFYQWDYLWFQIRRASDPGFFRHIFMLSHKSPNFHSNRLFVTKMILMDICAGKFNTDQLSGIPSIDSVHKKNKEGDYHPRQTRRRLNEELREVVFKKDRQDLDERKLSYITVFNVETSKTSSLLKKAEKMWKAELNSQYIDEQSVIEQSKPIFLQEIYPERWNDLKELQKKMLEIMQSFEVEIKNSKFFSALYDEIKTFTTLFVTLSNHINSICEIFWFMKKESPKRTALLISQIAFKIDESDIEKTFSIMTSIGWSPTNIVNDLILVPGALLFFRQEKLAISLIKSLITLENNDALSLPLSLNFIAILRDAGKYKEMLELSNTIIEKYNTNNDLFTLALLKIRNAEALSLNGKHIESVTKLEEIFEKRDQFKGYYVPYRKAIKLAFDYILKENEPKPEEETVPVRVSILENLLHAAYRISEYCLVKKYLEELFESESEYFKREDATDSFINLNDLYTKVILRCESKT